MVSFVKGLFSDKRYKIFKVGALKVNLIFESSAGKISGKLLRYFPEESKLPKGRVFSRTTASSELRLNRGESHDDE
jgi:hypothetical protein